MAESNITGSAHHDWILGLNPTTFDNEHHQVLFYTYWILWLNPTWLASAPSVLHLLDFMAESNTRCRVAMCQLGFIPTGFYG
jgi:hypothetical protein